MCSLPKVDRGNHAIDYLARNLNRGVIPSLWGEGIFTYSSVLLSELVLFVGLWVDSKSPFEGQLH
jgi:hypothetical protein